MSFILEELSEEENTELANFTELESNGYELASCAHEVVKGVVDSETDIWSKEGALYIGDSLNDLKVFNGYVKRVFVNDKFIGTAVIDFDNEDYSLKNVLCDIEEEIGHSMFTLKDQ